VFFLSYMHPSNGRGVKLMTLKKRFMGDNPWVRNFIFTLFYFNFYFSFESWLLWESSFLCIPFIFLLLVYY
jgi:hypothetical protein